MLSPDLYIRVREREGRLYSDELVENLPQVPRGHPLQREWAARSDSLARLERYIERLPAPTNLLDLGCGSGWLSHRVAAIPGLRVWALDQFGLELVQAARIFAGRDLAFLAADIFVPPFANGTFDFILVASAIQYFPDLPALVRKLRGLLTPRGELHIMDSPLYDELDLASARERTRAYYAALGVPEMAVHYFHHTVVELEQFAPHWHYRPNSLPARLAGLFGRVDSPFPWLSIRR